MGRRRKHEAQTSVKYYRGAARNRAKVVRTTITSKQSSIATEATCNSCNCQDHEFESEFEGAFEPLDLQDDCNAGPDNSCNDHAEPSRFKEFCEAESDRWAELLRTRTLADGVAKHYSLNKCVACGSADGLYRCEKCHLLSVCLKCLEVRHSHQPPHVVQLWNGTFYEVVPTEVRLLRQCGCMGVSSMFPVTVITEEVNEISLTVEVCSCTTYHEALLAHGFWPIQARPENARLLTAVSISLLLFIDCLNCHCTASLSSLCAAFRHFRNSMWIPTTMKVDLFRALNVTGSFRAFRSVLQSLRWGQKTSCPACYVKKETSANPSPVFLMMDACFGIRHRKNAGKAAMPPASGFFIDVDLSKGFQPSDGHCVNWSAGGRGQGLASGADRNNLDVYGLFCGSCQHSFIRYMEDVTTPGERLNYGESMVQQMLCDTPPHVPIIVSYDISCKLAGRFCDPRLTFALPVLHVYGHVLLCQLLFGIRATESAGLTDGESAERIWPRLRRFGPQVKEMAHDNRRDFLNYVADAINFQQMMSITAWLQSRRKVEEKALLRFETDLSKFVEESKLNLNVDEFLQKAAEWREEILPTLKAKPAAATSRKAEAIRSLHRVACERQYLIDHADTSLF